MSAAAFHTIWLRDFLGKLPCTEEKVELLAEVPLGSNYFIFNAGREDGKPVHQVRSIVPTSFRKSNMSVKSHLELRGLTDDCQLALTPAQIQMLQSLS